METQRYIGGILGGFSAIVLFSWLLEGKFEGFVVYLAIITAVLIATALVDDWFMALLQIAMIAMAGVITVLFGSTQITIIIFSCSYILAYTYGFLDRAFWTKTIIYVISIFSIYTIGGQTWRNSILLICFCLALTWVQYLVVKHFVDKAKAFDALEMKVLQKEIIEKKHLLEVTVQAGMILVKEIKAAKGGRRVTREKP
jgi:hypothetical protein